MVTPPKRGHKPRAQARKTPPEPTAVDVFTSQLRAIEDSGQLSGFAYVIFTAEGQVSIGHAGLTPVQVAAVPTFLTQHSIKSQGPMQADPDMAMPEAKTVM